MRSKQKEHEGLITKGVAASELGVSIRTLDRLVKDAGLPALRVGRQTLFSKPMIARWIEVQTRVGGDR